MTETRERKIIPLSEFLVVRDKAGLGSSSPYAAQLEMMTDVAKAISGIISNHQTYSWDPEVKLFEPPNRPSIGIEVFFWGFDPINPPEAGQVFIHDLMTSIFTTVPRMFPSLVIRVERFVPPMHRAHGFVVRLDEAKMARPPVYPNIVRGGKVVLRRKGWQTRERDNRDVAMFDKVLKVLRRK